jgi:hypothetical protein
VAKRADADVDDEVDEIAAALYALAPEAFTAARNARAGRARPPVGSRVKALRKPTAAAWAVNALVRDGQLAEAIRLSDELREAQDDLDAAELSRLGKQRRQLVRALAARATDLADDAGVSISAAARIDIEKTINAAVTDAAAAAAVLTARLVRPLEATGVEPVELDGAVGGSIPGVRSRPAPAQDDLAERRARKAAEKAAREAERAAATAEREAERLESRLVTARERADLLRERVDDLRAQLARAEEEATTADDTVDQLEKERASADETARAARAAATRAAAHPALDG